jgi:hypothetical protein
MPYPCFSYWSDVPPSATERAIPDLRRMPGGSPSGCFSCFSGKPLYIGNRGTASRVGRGIRKMPGDMGACFSYRG